ncbi:T-cell surface glycoprotein CD3 zeta chain [Discoglossus pictus]
MKSKWVTLIALLQAQVLVADAEVLGLTNPKLCYVLDCFLFLYAIIITALFFKEKFTQQKAQYNQEYDPYSELQYNQQAKYDELNRGRDPEVGGKRQKKKMPDSSVYTDLKKDKTVDQYSEIAVKGEGLRSGARDTYDALQMQPLPPTPLR